ncbi:redoxin domain-containing protein [Deinococcus sp. VB142]|uniref:Redoxin domain-containing protein n=1 Tax=Deinococcus sp. VB142 TaxID=3112952 RepID=A0AAU6Q3D7_9DEIO
MRLHVGQPVPSFQARSDQGEALGPATLRGHWAVLHFYGKPEEASGPLQDFEAAQPEFERLGARVIGIGAGTEAEQARWRERLGLTFALIPDGDGAVARAFGLGGLGARLMPRARRQQTFLITPEGQVSHHWGRVEARGHAGAVLETLRLKVGEARA